MKLFLSLLLTVLLLGCATPQVCSSSQIQLIKDTNITLLESKNKILGYESGNPIPGIIYSSLQKADIINSYKESYNRSVILLQAQAKQCNLNSL